MSDPQFTETQIASIVRRLQADRQAHDQRLRVRRLLIDMVAEAWVPGNGTGTNIPAPFNKSQLIIQSMMGDLASGVRQYAAIFAANRPRVAVMPVVVERDEATRKASKTAGEQERLLHAMWDKAGGRRAQYRVGYSQGWGRVGWYFTLPRKEAYGLPDRLYYADLTETEIDELTATGKVTPVPIARGDGTVAYAESGTAYLERRREASAAMAADSLMMLTTFAPDVVYPAYNVDGTVKYAAAVLEVPSLDFGPGSDYAKSAAAFKDAPEIAQFGLVQDAQGRIVGGMTQGGESGVHAATTWYYTIFATAEELYCMVSASQSGAGTLIWYAKHSGGRCPLIPAPAFHTDSSRPGSEYSSPMEKVFAEAAPINQLMTLLSLDAAYNGIPRWIFVRPNGSIVQNPATGDPVTVASETPPGLDAAQAGVTDGTPVQLKVDADLLFKVLEFYVERFEKGMPSPAVVGAEGFTGSTAWGLRQSIEQALADMQQPVDNNAEAVEEVFQLWLRWLGDYDTDLYAYAAPKTTGSNGPTVGLIRFDPANLVTSIRVSQSSDTAQAKVIKQQAGIEAMQAGVATLGGYFEDYTDVEDSRQAEMNIYADRMLQMAMFGTSTGIEQGSAAYDYMLALRGQMSQQMLAIPAVALKTATDMATQAQAQFAQQQAVQTATQQMAQQGNPAEAMGIRQPGMGMSMQPPGEAQLGAPVTPQPAGVS